MHSPQRTCLNLIIIHYNKVEKEMFANGIPILKLKQKFEKEEEM